MAVLLGHGDGSLQVLANNGKGKVTPGVLNASIQPVASPPSS
jgi:hypothetical protein